MPAPSRAADMPELPALAPARRADTLREQVYRALHERLARGEIDPSVRLTETQLAALLGVSRTPVREALVRLRQEGLLDPRSRGSAALALTRRDIAEIMEMRLLLEPAVAARAAGNATSDTLVPLAAALAREAEAVSARSSERFARANHDFRDALLALAGNQRLAETARRFDSQLQSLRVATLTDPENRRKVVRHHRRLLAALGRCDAGLAEATMRALLESARDSALALSAIGPEID